MSDWMWPSPSPVEEVEEEAGPDDRGDQPDDHRGRGEHPQRLVQRVDAEDRGGVAPHVGPHRGEQARLARLGVRPDLDVVDGHEHLARLDDRLQRVGELGDHLHLQRGLAVVGAEARGGVGDGGARGAADHGAAQVLELLLERREVLDLAGLAVADDHVGAPGQDRLDQLLDVAAVVLVVGVGVDDHVGAELQAGVEAGLEAGGQALVVGQAHDVVHAVRAGHLDGVVGGAVVDDQPLDASRRREARAGGRRASPAAARPR